MDFVPILKAPTQPNVDKSTFFEPFPNSYVFLLLLQHYFQLKFSTMMFIFIKLITKIHIKTILTHILNILGVLKNTHLLEGHIQYLKQKQLYISYIFTKLSRNESYYI